ncbi:MULTISPECIES: ricin-type beta-trefoil lectin domain protein [unclassified Streptomyces]|uniref:ricin-type beta-trefoil lectin domain protein n=1 Tax=unclassified Streptomyces TaxID=2593676 RepID=UPI002E104CBC|nr:MULTISPECIES: ricin-type beta-trefoil lectin domain protein [unclassified Streptomyces]WSR22265.1 ricin-type beta-trefoil lectin domain protein [Streptomyces sp. NBC_01205]
MPPRLRASLPCLTAAALLAFCLAPAPAAAEPHATSDTPLALTPPMGWNNWAHYMCDIDEAKVVANADALVSSGLAAKGYDTVTVDDCWMTKSRDADGNLVVDTQKFPHGMAWLGEHLHAKGLKFGIYEDAGSLTCERYPGSGSPDGGGPDHYAQDARQFASWKVDYVKMDGCNLWVPPGTTKEQAYRDAYGAVAEALRTSGRDMVLSASAPAYFQQGEWGGSDWHKVLGWVGETGQLWREGKDIKVYNAAAPATSRWSSVLGNYGYNRWLGRYAGPGNWNDPDFLIAGAPGLTEAESRSQVGLWAMMAAPFILSSDVSRLTPAGLAALGNTDLIALDQDPMGRQGAVLSANATFEVLARPLADGDRAVAVLNRSGSTRDISVPLADIGLSTCTVDAEDLWSGKSTEVSTSLSGKLAAHDTAVWRLSPREGCGAAVPTGQITGNGAQCADGVNTTGVGAVVLAPCTAAADQRWVLGPDSSVRLTGECLSAGENGAVELADCAPGEPGQRWTHRRDGALVEDVSGMCLTAPAAAATPDAPAERLKLTECGDHRSDQAWSLPV